VTVDNTEVSYTANTVDGVTLAAVRAGLIAAINGDKDDSEEITGMGEIVLAANGDEVGQITLEALVHGVAFVSSANAGLSAAVVTVSQTVANLRGADDLAADAAAEAAVQAGEVATRAGETANAADIFEISVEASVAARAAESAASDAEQAAADAVQAALDATLAARTVTVAVEDPRCCYAGGCRDGADDLHRSDRHDYFGWYAGSW
jgi:hypothetical protein